MKKIERKNISLFKEYAKFGATGVVNTAVDLALLNSLLLLFASQPQGGLYILFKTLSFIGAVTVSYYLNTTWVFSGRASAEQASIKKEGGKFFLVSIFGLLVNVSVSFLVFTGLETTGTSYPTLSANIAALVGTACTVICNYTGYKYLVFTNSITKKLS